jgi:hypothetical protein
MPSNRIVEFYLKEGQNYTSAKFKTDTIRHNTLNFWILQLMTFAVTG